MKNYQEVIVKLPNTQINNKYAAKIRHICRT